jgi:hypothetical protein
VRGVPAIGAVPRWNPDAPERAAFWWKRGARCAGDYRVAVADASNRAERSGAVG